MAAVAMRRVRGGAAVGVASRGDSCATAAPDSPQGTGAELAQAHDLAQAQVQARALTSAPITPRLVSRRYSKGRVLEMVLRKGYRNSGMWAAGGGGWGGSGRWCSSRWACCLWQQQRSSSSADAPCSRQLQPRLAPTPRAMRCGRAQLRRSLTLQEKATRLRVAGNTLQQRQRIAHAVGRVRRQAGRLQHGVDGHNLLQQRRHGAKAVPEVGRKLGERLALLAELQQRCLLGGGVGQVKHQLLLFA